MDQNLKKELEELGKYIETIQPKPEWTDKDELFKKLKDNLKQGMFGLSPSSSITVHTGIGGIQAIEKAMKDQVLSSSLQQSQVVSNNLEKVMKQYKQQGWSLQNQARLPKQRII